MPCVTLSHADGAFAGASAASSASLRRPLHDGTRAVAFTPMEWMKRLATWVPPPKRDRMRSGAGSSQ
jgi:hypothetical protein